MDRPEKPRKQRYPEAPAKPPTQAGIEREELQGENWATATRKAITAIKGSDKDKVVGRSAHRLYSGYLAEEMQVGAPSHLVLCKDWAVASASADRLMAAAVDAGLVTDEGLKLAREARAWSQRAERVLTTLRALDQQAADRRKGQAIDVGKAVGATFK